MIVCSEILTCRVFKELASIYVHINGVQTPVSDSTPATYILNIMRFMDIVPRVVFDSPIDE